MKQILTILTTFGAMMLISATASASSPNNGVSHLTPAAQPTTTVLNARDALGIVAQCYGGGYGNAYYGGGYNRGFVPVRRSYYRGGGGGLNINVGRGVGFGGVPYGYGRGFDRGFGRGYGRGYGRGFGGSGFGLYLNL